MSTPKRPRPRQEPKRQEEPVYRVIVECASEDQQRQVYEWLKAKGYRCRLLTI